MDTSDSKPLTYGNDIAQPPAALGELCAMSNWVVWRWTKNGSGKWTKPPFQSRFPSGLARNNEATTWSSHADAVETVRDGKADGVGFVLTGTNVVAIDLDRCRDPAREPANDNLLGRTLAVWQPRAHRELGSEDARQIAENVCGFFSILRGWSHAEKLSAANDNQNQSSSVHGAGEVGHER
jgi:hypothetical protein